MRADSGLTDVVVASGQTIKHRRDSCNGTSSANISVEYDVIHVE